MPVRQIEHDPFALAHLAALGRRGDSVIGHLKINDVIVPEELQTPQILAVLKLILGAKFARFRVGNRANFTNPRTGLVEFEGTDGGDGEGPGGQGSTGASGPGTGTDGTGTGVGGVGSSSASDPNEGKDVGSPSNNPSPVADPPSAADLAAFPETTLPGAKIVKASFLDQLDNALTGLIPDHQVLPGQTISAPATQPGIIGSLLGAQPAEALLGALVDAALGALPGIGMASTVANIGLGLTGHTSIGRGVVDGLTGVNGPGTGVSTGTGTSSTPGAQSSQDSGNNELVRLLQGAGGDGGIFGR